MDFQHSQTYLEVLAINLMNDIFVLLVYDLSRRRLGFHGTDFLTSISFLPIRVLHGYGYGDTHTMGAVLKDLGRIFEAPLADIEPICLAASHQIFGVEGRVPGLNVQIAEHHVGDIRRGHGLVWRLLG